MDNKEAGKEASEDSTRESLIAISYPVSDKDYAPGLSPKNTNSKNAVEGINKNAVEGINGDGAETYRSKLISISYTKSPDTKVLPVSPGKH